MCARQTLTLLWTCFTDRISDAYHFVDVFYGPYLLLRLTFMDLASTLWSMRLTGLTFSCLGEFHDSDVYLFMDEFYGSEAYPFVDGLIHSSDT